jgi:hypothetical protein
MGRPGGSRQGAELECARPTGGSRWCVRPLAEQRAQLLNLGRAPYRLVLEQRPRVSRTARASDARCRSTRCSPRKRISTSTIVGLDQSDVFAEHEEHPNIAVPESDWQEYIRLIVLQVSAPVDFALHCAPVCRLSTKERQRRKGAVVSSAFPLSETRDQPAFRVRDVSPEMPPVNRQPLRADRPPPQHVRRLEASAHAGEPVGADPKRRPPRPR